MFKWLHNQKFNVAFYKKFIHPEVPKKYGKLNGDGKFIIATSPRIQKVMILFKLNLDFEIESAIADNIGWYLLQKTSIFESSLLLSNIYAPNDITTQIAFFRNLNNILLPYADSLAPNEHL